VNSYKNLKAFINFILFIWINILFILINFIHTRAHAYVLYVFLFEEKIIVLKYLLILNTNAK